jgi:hypothetical protein
VLGISEQVDGEQIVVAQEADPQLVFSVLMITVASFLPDACFVEPAVAVPPPRLQADS